MPFPTRRSAFSLAECLVAVLVVSVLLALAVPAIRGSRLAQQRQECLSRVRQLGSLVTIYSLDFRNSYPAWVSDESEIVSNRKYWDAFTLQSFRLFGTPAWFDYTNTTLSQAIYRCPANQRLRSTSVLSEDFVGVQAMYAEPGYLDPTLRVDRWKSRLGAKVQRLDGVAFPSLKIGLIEMFVWHGWNGVYGPGGNAQSLSFFNANRPGSVWFFDGHVEQLAKDDLGRWVDRAPIWWSGPGTLTEYGALGRDR